MTSVRRVVVTVVLASAAACTPLVAAMVVRQMGGNVARYEVLSVGTLTALAVGALAGLKRGGLWALLSGPAVGFVVGLLDLRAFVWLYGQAGFSMDVAAAVPVWGLLFGVWGALQPQAWWRRVLTILVVAGADLAARLTWSSLASDGSLSDLAEWRWLLESLTYAPPAVCLVLLMPRRIRSPAAGC